MKIRTITCHDVNNYGASLQALALQTFLTELGHDVKIIDYLPEYSIPYNIWKVHPSSHLYKVSKYSHLVKLFCAARTYLRIRPTLKRKDAFREFNRKYLSLTRHYDKFTELATDPPEADVYIAGSDQIWRTNLCNGKDPAFYLQFGAEKTKRISYAASFGLPYITDGLEYLIKTYLSSFDCISVRESSGIEILRNLGISGELVMDPVFLLSGKEWKELLEITKSSINDPYILVYDLNQREMREEKESAVKEYAEKYHLKIVAVNDIHETPYAQINIDDAGPVEFVNLISHASYVVSDSFHATAFCTIMHTPFSVFFSRPQAVRISDYLSMLGLSMRMNNRQGLYDIIDWDDVQLIMDRNINRAKDFLCQNIQ